MRTKKMINLMAGLFFTGILCLNGGAFGYVSSDEVRPISEVVFIDPSVREAAAIVAQLPEGAEVVQLSPGMDGVEQISTHLAKKRDLSAIHIISHGNAGHFVLNGKRIDTDFLKDHGHGISGWGRSLTENGDILLYACNLAATDEGKTFVERFLNLTGADVAASTDITGGEAFSGNWDLEYSIGRIATTALAIDPNMNVKLSGSACTWEGTSSSDWSEGDNWSCETAPGSGDDVIINNHVEADDPNMNVSTTFSSFTINSGKTLHITPGGVINTTGDVTNNGTISAGSENTISISAGGQILLNGLITSQDGFVTIGSGNSDGIVLTGASTITSTSGTVTFMDPIDSDSTGHTLNVDAGTGLIDFQQAIGSGVIKPTTLTITQSGGTTFQGNVTTSTSVVLTDTADAANITFTGTLVTPTLTSAAEPYDLDLHGSGTTITNAVAFLHTGTLALGNTADDTLLFDGALTATAPSGVTLNGQVRTSGDTISIGDAGTGVTLAGTTSILDTTSGTVTGADISVGGTVDGAAANTQGLTVNGGTGGTATFSGHIGETTPIATLTLTNGDLATTDRKITASGISVNGGTFGLAASPAGAWDVGDVTIASGATMNATTGDFNVSGDWANSGTFNHKDGTVTFDGTGQTLSGATSFYNLTKNVNAADMLTFTSGTANRTTITNALDLKGQENKLLSLRSSADDTQWEIDPQGTRAIEYLDVQNSNNVGATNINAVGQNCTDSGNNTKWSFTQLTSGTYYVNIASGNDSNSGSSANPWKTFHYAIDRINNAAAGTYVLHIKLAGELNYDIGEGESDSKLVITQDNVTLVGETGSMPVIDGTDCETWKTGIIIEGDNVKIRNLDVRSFSETGIYVSSDCSGHEINGCDVHGNTTGIADNSNGCTIKGCKVYSNNDDGITSNQTTSGVITRNTVYGNGLGGSSRNGIFIAECSPVVSRNKVYDNYRNISIEGWSAATTSPTVKNNLIYEVSETVEKGIYVYANHASAVVSPNIYHNTIDLCKDGIALEENNGTSAPQIKYNIVTNSNEVGIRNNSANPTVVYNDVWNNTQNYSGFEGISDTNISENPLYGSYTLQSDSPCIDAIPTGADPGDPVTMDYLGYSRPQGSGFDMGAYEYVATKTYPDTLPGGTGVETDYRIFTVPLDIGTGQDMRNTMEGTLGSYAQTHWRVFARTTSGDVEMNTQAFTSLDIKPGMGFWLITVYTNTISFQGTLAPDAIYYEIQLAPGWHLFAIPWPNTSIELGRIYVTDGVNQYTITDASNTLTQKYIWDYTGTGPSSGHVERSASDFSLVAGTGYFIKILGSSNITLSIPPNNSSNPPNNNSVSTLHTVSYESLESVRLPDDSESPPLPSGSYGPMPNIRANGESGPLTVSRGTPVSVKVSLDPGNRPIEKADWWVTAHTPFLPPNNWYSYVYPDGWKPGIHVCVQTLPFQVPPSFEVLNMALPRGEYTFYFALDENADGIVDETWVDSVDVRVE